MRKNGFPLMFDRMWFGLMIFGLFFLSTIDIVTAAPLVGLQRKAELDRKVFPAAGRQEAVLSVSHCGRYSIYAESSQGTALQMVDRMTGPGRIFGVAGKTDGRIDAVLDRGVYKIILSGHEKATGKVTLHSRVFEERHLPMPPRLVEHKVVETTLLDFEQRSYWIEIEKRRYVVIEVAGRNLADLRLWKDGSWLVDSEPGKGRIDPYPGRPMAVRRIVALLNPGMYLLTAYGGPGLPWAEQQADHPLYLRSGIQTLSDADRRGYTTSLFGVDRWFVPEPADYFRLEIPEADDAEMIVSRVTSSNLFSEQGQRGVITKQSVPPVAEVSLDPHKGYRLVTIRCIPGKEYILEHFEKKDIYRFRGNGAYWISTIHSGHGRDFADATAILTGKYRMIKSSAVRLDFDTGWSGRFNLSGSMTLFLEVGQPGKYRVEVSGIDARHRVEPFLTVYPDRYKPPEFRSGAESWELDAGIYVLSLKSESVGIVDLRIGSGSGRIPDSGISKPAVRFERVFLSDDEWYELHINSRPGIVSGMVMRRLPIDLSRSLPVTQLPGETVRIPVIVLEKGDVTAVSETGELLPLSVDYKAPGKRQTLDPGQWMITVDHRREQPVYYSLQFAPHRLDPGTPLPEVSPTLLQQLPNFDILEDGKPQFFDVQRNEHKTFQVRVDSPGFYQIESTGLLETEGNLRTRTVTSIDRKSANGIGRNFLIQQYLREGDYQLTTTPMGMTNGHMGLQLSQTRMHDGGRLINGISARFSLKAGQGLVYRFTIDQAGEYHLKTMGMGRVLRARLEDENGWPVYFPAATSDITRQFLPGNYRYVILPEPLDCRVLTLLEKAWSVPAFKGHGPHEVLPEMIGQRIEYEWMEPEKEGKRIRDKWRFHVPASADVEIRVSDDMLAFLHPEGLEEPLRLPANRPWKGKLDSGHYLLELESIYPDNRLRYFFQIDYLHLMEGFDKAVDLPADLNVSAGQDALIELSSFGDQDVRAFLYDSDGHLIAHNDDRPDDWNFYIARWLSKGTYRLRVEPVSEKSGKTVVSMIRPVETMEDPLTLPAGLTIEGGQLHTYPLKINTEGDVLLITAASDSDVSICIEQDKENGWRSLGQAVGQTPRLAVVLDKNVADKKYRLRLQSIDRRSTLIRVQAAVVVPKFITEEAFSAQGLIFVPIEDINHPTGISAIQLKEPGIFRFETDGCRNLMMSSLRDHQICEADNPVIVVRGDFLWLMGDPGQKRIRASRVKLDDGIPLRLTLAPGYRTLAELSQDKKTALIQACSRSGQPGIRPSNIAGGLRNTGFSDGSAVTIVNEPGPVSVELWNAGNSENPLSIDLFRYDFDPPQIGKMYFGLTDVVMEAKTANAYTLPAGWKQIRLSLPENTAVVMSNDTNAESVLWTGKKVKTITVHSEADRLILFHIGKDRGIAGVSIAPFEPDPSTIKLTSNQVFRRSFPAAGTFRLQTLLSPTEKEKGVILRLFGSDVHAMLGEDSGRIRRGKNLSFKTSGTIDLQHGSGLVMAWLEGGEKDPWKVQGATINVVPPIQVRLQGRGMKLALDSKSPSMLHIDTGSPVVACFKTHLRSDRLEVFPESANFGIYLPASEKPVEIHLHPAGQGSLAGFARLLTTQITVIGEGAGPSFRLEPGGTRLFSFFLKSDRTIGIGIRSTDDTAGCRLLDSSGSLIGTGMVQMHQLKQGEYLIAVEIPSGGTSAVVQPVITGIEKTEGPPFEEVKKYLEMEGLKADR